MYDFVHQAHQRSRYLGFDSSVGVDSFPQPPRSTHAAVLHLALPGDPSLTAGSILPMHMGPLKPSPQLEHAQTGRVLGSDEEGGASGEAGGDNPNVFAAVDVGQRQTLQEREPDEAKKVDDVVDADVHDDTPRTKALSPRAGTVNLAAIVALVSYLAL